MIDVGANIGYFTCLMSKLVSIYEKFDDGKDIDVETVAFDDYFEEKKLIILKVMPYMH